MAGIKAHIYVEWRLNESTMLRFMDLIKQYEQFEDGSLETEMVVDEIKRLPGFPTQAPVGSDFLLVRTDRLN